MIVSQSSPRPIVMFASDAAARRSATRCAPASRPTSWTAWTPRASTASSRSPARASTEFQRLKIELAEANLKLSERKLVERAKGLLMQSRGLSEDEAYHALRKLAMSKKLRLGDVAQQVIDTAELLGKG